MPDGTTQQTPLEIYMLSFFCMELHFHRRFAWYISDQNTAHWTAYESGRIVEWVTVRVDVGDGG